MVARAMVLLMPWARATSSEEHERRLAEARKRLAELRGEAPAKRKRAKRGKATR